MARNVVIGPRTYATATADQSGSRLLQLPAEIRLIILRMLLVSPDALDKHSTYGKTVYKKVTTKEPEIPDCIYRPGTGMWRSEQRQIAKKLARGEYPLVTKTVSEKVVEIIRTYSLYPRILGTCQILYNEGQSILYGENTIVLTVRSGTKGGRHRLHCQALREDFHVLSTEGRHGAKLTKIAKYIQQFNNIKLQIEERTTRDLETFAFTCNAIKDMVKNKKIHISFETTESIIVSPVLGIQNLNVLRCFRCTTCHISLNDNVADLGALAAIKRVITSEKSPVDLSPVLETLQDVRKVLAVMYKEHLKKPVNDLDRQYKDLAIAVHTFELERFEGIRASLLEEFEQCSKMLAEKVHQSSEDARNSTTEQSPNRHVSALMAELTSKSCR